MISYTKKTFFYVIIWILIILLLSFLFSPNDEKEYNRLYEWEEIWNQREWIQNLDIILPLQKEKIIDFTSSSNIHFTYTPIEIKQDWEIWNIVWDISQILFSSILKEKNISLNILLSQYTSLVRAKYINNTIKIFNIKNIPKTEIIALFIHELGHYFDIKYLEKKVIFDLSDHFSNISWEDTKVLYAGSKKEDFVSGYAMTNKYEDFAETFVYYILYNDDFRNKMNTNTKLEQKYNFFSKYIFRNDEFKKTNFRNDETIADYYWDTTKIKFSLQNFLEYLKKWVYYKSKNNTLSFLNIFWSL